MEDNNTLPLYSEILPRLFLGGTENFDVVQETKRERVASIPKESFDTVISLYAWSNPAGWGVKEFRYGFYDGDMKDIDFEIIEHLVDVAYDEWKNKGKRLLIRCQKGYNRSSFILCQVLMRDGYTAKEAIALMRARRSSWVLCNPDFEKWLLNLDERREMSREI